MKNNEENIEDKKHFLSYDLYKKFDSINPEMGDLIRKDTTIKVTDDTLLVKEYLENLVRHLQKKETISFEVPFNKYGGKFVWIPNEKKEVKKGKNGFTTVQNVNNL